METLYIILAFILGAVLAYFIVKSSSVSRDIHDSLNQNFIKSQSDLENSSQKISELSQLISEEKGRNQEQTDILNDLKSEFSKISAEHHALQSQFAEQREINFNQSITIQELTGEKQNILLKILNFCH